MPCLCLPSSNKCAQRELGGREDIFSWDGSDERTRGPNRRVVSDHPPVPSVSKLALNGIDDEGDGSANANVEATFSSDAPEGTEIDPQDLIL